jgi:hypothetical protein
VRPHSRSLGRACYKRVVRFGLCVLVVLVVCAGCSREKPAQPTTTTSARPKVQPTQSRWAKEVDAACKPWQRRIDAVTPAPTNNASLQVWLTRTLPLVRKQIAAVDAVEPPNDQAEAKKVTKFLAGLHKTERALTRYLAAVRSGATAKAQKTLSEASASGAALRAQAKALDITQCGGYASG